MLENDIFASNLEFHFLNKTVNDVVNILKSQASMKNIKILIKTLPNDICAKLDQLRL